MASTSLNMSAVEEEDDYYTFFNIPRAASAAEITAAYKRMSRTYHPDRHVDPKLKEAADVAFDKICKIYGVLMDPERRAIYDTVGPRGLEVTGWELAEVGHSPDEVRAQYERLQRLREDQLLRENVNPTCGITAHLNATQLFQPAFGDCFRDESKDWPYVEVSSVGITQSLEAPLTVDDRLGLSGGVVVANGVGQAALSSSWKRLISTMSWAQAEVTLGEAPSGALKLVRTFNKYTSGSLTLQSQLVDGEPLFGLVGAMTRQLDPRLTGTITAKVGLQNAVTTTLAYDDGRRKRVVGSLIVGLPASYVSLAYTQRFPSADAHVRLSLKMGPTIGAITELGWEGKLSEYNRGGAAFRVNFSRGTLIIKLKFQRGAVSYDVSVDVCDSAEFLPASFAAAVLAPAALFVVGRVAIRPLRRRWAERQNVGGDSRRKDELVAERRREALASLELMRESARRSVESESAIDGVVVTSALYGRLLSAELLQGMDLEDVERTCVIDVTIPLQHLVKDSKIILFESKKSGIAGFYDPCPGERKRLAIVYRFQGAEHRVTVEDDAPITIPKQSHKIA